MIKMRWRKFPFYQQLDGMDCGPTCLRMIAQFYGKKYSLSYLREKGYITREGVSMLGISQAAEAIGFRTMGAKLTLSQLLKQAPLPVIVHWNQNHFVVVHKARNGRVEVADPGMGLLTYSEADFLAGWIGENRTENEKGVALLLEPTRDFYLQEEEPVSTKGFRYLKAYLTPYKWEFFQVMAGLLVGSFLHLLFPILTQKMVDEGIGHRDIGFIYLILAIQMVLFISQTLLTFVRSWILLHIGTRINVSLIADFLIRLMKLPLGFFDSHLTGDLMQRIQDHERIKTFLTQHGLQAMFSIVTLLVFGAVMMYYSMSVFLIFLLGSASYFGWILIFFKKRKILDMQSFEQQALDRDAQMEIIHGIQEIKLNNIERQKRWQWEKIQADLFQINLKKLALVQYQEVGAFFFHEGKNILITCFIALAVVQGEMSLGMMLAVSYILGQMNGPIFQLVNFLQAAQDAKISLDRLNEIHYVKQEQLETGKPPSSRILQDDIRIENLSFK
ncbi:MAG: cysteine peptidase family C39 domain-containing protein, partial [Bacteroidota bacterium]